MESNCKMQEIRMQKRASFTGLGILAIAGLLFLQDIAAIAADPPQEGLAAYWSFDAIEDGTVSDESSGGTAPR